MIRGGRIRSAPDIMKTSWKSIEAGLSKSPWLLPRPTSSHISVSVVRYQGDVRIRVEANVSAGWREFTRTYGFFARYNDHQDFFCELLVTATPNRLKQEASQFPAHLIGEYKDRVVDCTLTRGFLNVFVPWVKESEFWRESEQGNLFLNHSAYPIAAKGSLKYALKLRIVYLSGPGQMPFASAGLPGSGKKG